MSGRRDRYRFVRKISKDPPKKTAGVDSQATAYRDKKSFKWLREDTPVPSSISGDTSATVLQGHSCNLTASKSPPCIGASSKPAPGAAVPHSAPVDSLPRPGISVGVREKKRAAASGGASYVRNKNNQLCRISASIANRADTGRNHETSRGLQRAENLVRKTQHSLVRRGSLVSAVARTVAKVRETAPLGAARLWLGPQPASLYEPSQLSARLTRTRRWVRNGQLQWPRKGFGTTWQTGKPVAKAAPAARAHPWKGRHPISAESAHWKASQSKQKAPAKLVRMGGSLYKVVRGARGGSLRRQAPVNFGARAPAKQAYKRWGFSLRRTGAAPPKTQQEALTRLKQGVLARPLQTAGFLGVKRKQTARSPPANGVIARIRGRAMLTNTPCIEYCRTGTCADKEKGTCQKIHDPKKVAICSFWLNSTCNEANCPFQHVVQSDLMPLCSHFIKGSCSTFNCPYLHVKHDAGTPVCKAFLKGYCPKGAACSHRHLTTRMLRELSRSAASSAVRKESRGLKRRGGQLAPGEPAKRAAVASCAIGGEIGAGNESAAIRPTFLQ